jgi:hypothetical protein
MPDATFRLGMICLNFDTVLYYNSHSPKSERGEASRSLSREREYKTTYARSSR